LDAGQEADCVFSRAQVNLPSTAGDMGILSHHVPTIVQLKPGVVEVITELSQPGEKFFG
jgi:F-type H+-transporting ATPase subunit delta